MAESIAAHSPFLAFVNDAPDIETLKRFVESHGWAESCVNQGDIRKATEFLKDNPSPTLLLVEVPSANEAKDLLDKLSEVCSPETKVIVIGTVNEYSFYCWLMDIGISSYLLKPMNDQVLENAYLKSITHSAGAAGAVKVPGKVIAVIGARGGVGASTLALNIAGIISDLSKKNTALIDLDPQYGTLALTLDLDPSKGVREVLEKPDRMDSLFLERVMHKHGPHLSIWSAEETMQERLVIHEKAGDGLMKELKDKYQVIVLDMPRYLGIFGRKCLGQADNVIVATDLSLAGLRDTLRLSDLMRDALKLKPPIVVANRVGMAPKQAVKQDDFEKGVGAKIAYSIPFAPDVYVHVGPEIPAVKSKGHAAVKPLLALAAQLIPEVNAAPKDDKTAKKK